MKFDVFYLLKIMKITLLNMKIKEYTLNMIFNCSCDRRTRCIKNWNAQWDIWLVRSHENLIFTFVLLLTFKTVPCGHFCIFLTGLKNNNAYQRSAPWGFAEIWRIWGFVGWFVEFLCTIIETRWRFCMFKLTYLGYKNWKWVIFWYVRLGDICLHWISLLLYLFAWIWRFATSFNIYFEEQGSEKIKLKHIFGQQQGTESASNLMLRMAEGQSCVQRGFQISTVASQS